MSVFIKRIGRREIRFVCDTPEEGPQTREDCEYLIGRFEPHYPVPSIYCNTLISNRCDEKSNDIAGINMLFWFASTGSAQ